MRKSFLLVLLASIMLVGCGTEKKDEPVSEKKEISTETQSEEQDIQEEISFDSTELSDSNFVNSIKVADMIAKTNESSNIMFSPTSLNFALGIVSDGAKGETSELLANYLGAYSYGNKTKNYLDNLSKFNSDDTLNGYKTKLEIADALWVSDKVNLKEDYKGNVESEYNATVETVNFDNKEETCSIINKWVDTKTNSMIKEIISPKLIKPETVMCITNSVYFESAWAEAWKYHDYDVEEFTKSNGDKLDCCYMYTDGDGYYENDYATAFASNYVNGIKFIGILPKEEGNFNLEDLDIKGLLETKSYDYDELHVKMPKLNFETSANLNPMLKALGMGLLFEDDSDFTGIAEGVDLKVGSIIQKTNLELDENGTRAAAVTSIFMDLDSCVMQEDNPVIKEVYLDRPFAFLIYDEENDEVLFMGKVVTLDN